jgi:DNA-binding NarL/FixJ family response regulator
MRIVIADDHWTVRDGLKWMLSDETDIDVVGEAANGVELLEILATTDADIVLLDVNMPEMGGLEALEALRKTSPSLGVIVLSMHDKVVYVKRAVELGANGYLLKSAGKDELVRAIGIVAGGGSYVQGELTGVILESATSSAADTRPRLSNREHQVLSRVAQGEENKQIASALGISEATVKTYLKSIFERLEVHSRAEAVAVGLRLGIIE